MAGDWKFIQTYPMPDIGIDLLRAMGDVTEVFDPGPGEIEARMEGVHAIVAGTESITESVLESSVEIRVVGRFGAGVDSVDVEAATKRGIAVLNTPAANSQTVAEHAIALLLGITHHLAEGDSSIRTSGFELRPVLIGMELKGKTLGVIGLGDIGAKVARIANLGLGMNLLVHTAHPDPDRLVNLGIEGRFVELDELLTESDVVTLHAALTPATHNLLSRDRLALMNPGSYLINTARGALIDEDALVAMLEKEGIRGAGLDVYAVEPPSPDNPLLKLSNVVLTPHTSANSDEAFARMATMVCESIVQLLQGGQPENCVNPQVYE